MCTDKNEPIVVGNVQPWTSWTDAFKCKICDEGYFCIAFEFTYWKYGKEKYISEGCTKCTKQLIKQDKEYTSKDFWQSRKKGYLQFLDLGILDKIEGIEFIEEKVLLV